LIETQRELAPVPRDPEEWAYTPVVVEVYKSETGVILHRFLVYRLTFPDCIAALDAALAGLIPKLTPEQLPELRAVMRANNGPA